MLRQASADVGALVAIASVFKNDPVDVTSGAQHHRTPKRPLDNGTTFQTFNRANAIEAPSQLSYVVHFRNLSLESHNT